MSETRLRATVAAVAVVGALVVWITTSFAVGVGADSGFDDKDLRGPYGFAAAGSISFPFRRSARRSAALAHRPVSRLPWG